MGTPWMSMRPPLRGLVEMHTSMIWTASWTRLQ
jgi:hypothetical protein